MPDRVADVTRIVQGGRDRGLSDDQIRALVARYDERQQPTAPPAAATAGMLPPDRATDTPKPFDPIVTVPAILRPGVRLIDAWSRNGPEAVWRGAKQAIGGEYAKGANTALLGAGVTALPLAAPAMAASPFATLAAAGTGIVGGDVSSGAAKALGASDDQAALANTVGGLLSGGLTARAASGVSPNIVRHRVASAIRSPMAEIVTDVVGHGKTLGVPLPSVGGHSVWSRARGSIADLIEPEIAKGRLVNPFPTVTPTPTTPEGMGPRIFRDGRYVADSDPRGTLSTASAAETVVRQRAQGRPVNPDMLRVPQRPVSGTIGRGTAPDARETVALTPRSSNARQMLSKRPEARMVQVAQGIARRRIIPTEHDPLIAEYTGAFRAMTGRSPVWPEDFSPSRAQGIFHASGYNRTPPRP